MKYSTQEKTQFEKMLRVAGVSNVNRRIRNKTLDALDEAVEAIEAKHKIVSDDYDDATGTLKYNTKDCVYNINIVSAYNTVSSSIEDK